MIIRDVAMHDGEVILFNPPGFPNVPQLASGLACFGNNGDAAGFAVQPVDELGVRTGAQVQTRAADQAGIFIRLGRMANKSGRFVNDQKLAVLKNYFEETKHRWAEDWLTTPPQATGIFSRQSFPCHFSRLVYAREVKEKWHKFLPYIFMLLVAFSRWPGLFPPNFSAVYALAFCAGAFFPRQIKWWMPLGTLVVSDLLLNLYYYFALGINAFKPTQLVNYFVFAGIIWFGTRFNARSSFLRLLTGGIISAIVFYFVTNTAAWLFNPFGNPDYPKDLGGWITALTKGTHGYPTTIEFFRNTLLSGGLFTGLFAGAMKMTDAPEPAEEKEPQEAKEPQAEPEPEQA